MHIAVLLFWLLVSMFCSSLAPPSSSPGDAQPLFGVLALAVLLLAAWAEGKHWRSAAIFFVLGTSGAAWLVFVFWMFRSPRSYLAQALARRTSFDDFRDCLPWFLAAVLWGFACRIVAQHAYRRARAMPDHSRCSTCGYALRGLLERRCPECGASFDHAPPRA